MVNQMETKSISYIIEAIEELEDYIPLLDRQQHLDHDSINKAVTDLRNIFTTYKKEHSYGVYR